MIEPLYIYKCAFWTQPIFEDVDKTQTDNYYLI